ncbi:MAG: hypothetical protein AAFY20_18465 [Cyanobacteria bacterium J06639_14]
MGNLIPPLQPVWDEIAQRSHIQSLVNNGNFEAYQEALSNMSDAELDREIKRLKAIGKKER